MRYVDVVKYSFCEEIEHKIGEALLNMWPFVKDKEVSASTTLGDHERRIEMAERSDQIKRGIRDYLCEKYACCDVCGAMITKEKAVFGKSEVRERKVSLIYYPINIYDKEEYIYTPAYCITHAPRVPPPKSGGKK